jgi:regulator of replication initiation timing
MNEKDALIRMENDNAVLMPSASAMLAEFERQVKEIKAKEEELKQRILAEMEANGILKVETDELSITYVAPTSRESFDSKAFRKDNPDLYDEYVKISQVSASVRLKVK